MTETWCIHHAPLPYELQWQNLNADVRWLRLVRFLVGCIFILLFLILITPTIFLWLSNELLINLGLYDIFEYILKNYLSSLLLVIYQSAILPPLVTFLVKREKHIDKSLETLSAMHKYLLYNFLYVFILPIFNISFTDLVYTIFTEGFSEWQLSLGESMSHAGMFFTNFIIHQTFIKQGIDLLAPLQLIKRKFKLLYAITAEEKLLAHQSDEYSWHRQYAKTIVHFCIIVCTSIIYPLILPFGLLYFLVKYAVQKYCILCVRYVDPYRIGTRLFKEIMNALLMVIVVFQWIASLQLLICNSNKLRILGMVIGLSGLVIFVLTYRKTKKLIKLIKNQLIKDTVVNIRESLLAADPLTYMHPIERRLKGLERISSF